MVIARLSSGLPSYIVQLCVSRLIVRSAASYLKFATHLSPKKCLPNRESTLSVAEQFGGAFPGVARSSRALPSPASWAQFAGSLGDLLPFRAVGKMALQESDIHAAERTRIPQPARIGAETSPTRL